MQRLQGKIHQHQREIRRGLREIPRENAETDVNQQIRETGQKTAQTQRDTLSRNPERGRGRDGNPPPEDGKPHKQTKIRRNYNDYNV